MHDVEQHVDVFMQYCRNHRLGRMDWCLSKIDALPPPTGAQDTSIIANPETPNPIDQFVDKDRSTECRFKALSYNQSCQHIYSISWGINSENSRCRRRCVLESVEVFLWHFASPVSPPMTRCRNVSSGPNLPLYPKTICFDVLDILLKAFWNVCEPENGLCYSCCSFKE